MKYLESIYKKFIVIEIQNYIYLLIAVFIGGQIGNFLNLRIFSPKLLALVTAGLVLFVSISALHYH